MLAKLSLVVSFVDGYTRNTPARQRASFANTDGVQATAIKPYYNPDGKGCRVKRNFGQEHKFSGELYNYTNYVYLVPINSSNYT